METINFIQILYLAIQGALVSLLILFLFHIRTKMGLGLLFTALGLFQFIQVFLSSTIYFEIAKGIIISPGSAIFFTVSLFAILLIYIKDDATETRKVIYALLTANIVLSILLLTFSWQFKDTLIHNPFNVSSKLFSHNAWILFVGTITLFIDSLLIIVFYEFISKFTKSIFFKILLTMLIVVNFDNIAFSLISFHNLDNLSSIIYSGFISKSIVAVFYSTIFFIYLKYVEKEKNTKLNSTFKDVFHALSYREKYEIVSKEAEKALQLSESKYKTLANISPVGIFVTDAEGYTTYVNPKWCEIAGMKQNDALGYGWLKALHPDDRLIIDKNWGTAVKKEIKSLAEYRFQQADGAIKWVLGQAVPELDEKNKIIGYVGTITDISEIKQFEADLQKSKIKAEESDKLKSAFLANMSHEIRTPMNGIIGFADLLKDISITDKQHKEYLEIIEFSGTRMLNIINDIIDISKIEADQVKVHYSEINISDLILSLFNFFKPEASKKNIEFTLSNYDSNEEIIISSDKGKVNSIISNLIKNAIKYTNKGSIEIGFKIIDKKQLYFFVKDTGIGIQLERQHAIFDRFVQADILDTNAYQGAGLGLAISKAYIEMLNGEINLESKINSGSKFYFTIPINIITNYSKNDISKHNSKQLNEKFKLLIAEDDRISQLLLKSILSDFNCEIFSAKNGEEAINFCKENLDIDIILMDIKMPNIDGHTATKIIKKLNPNIKIIAQSAFALEHEINKYDGIFDAYLTKPVDKKKLQETITELIETSSKPLTKHIKS